MKKACLICNDLFDVKPSHYNKRKTCSKKCVAAHYSREFQGENNPNYKNSIQKKCQRCEKNYESYSKTRKYCSDDCANISNRGANYTPRKIPGVKNKKIRICKLCEEEVSGRLTVCLSCMEKKKAPHRPILIACNYCSKKTMRHPQKKHCSRACLILWRKKRCSGKTNPNYKGGIKKLSTMIRDLDTLKDIKSYILARDSFTCNKCGQIGGSLEVDHIVKFSIIFTMFIESVGYDANAEKERAVKDAVNYPPFWDLNNFQVLCKKCNWEKEILYRLENDFYKKCDKKVGLKLGGSQ